MMHPRFVAVSSSQQLSIATVLAARQQWRNFGRSWRCSAPSVALQPRGGPAGPSSPSKVSISAPATCRIELLHHCGLGVKHKAACGWRKPIVASYGTPAAVAAADVDESASANANTASTATVGGAGGYGNGLLREQGHEPPPNGSEPTPYISDVSSAADLPNLQVDMDELQALASKRCTPLRLVDMYKYAVDVDDPAQRLRNAQFLHKELPIRVAQRAVDLLTLPHGLSEALPVRHVAHVYLRYLQKFQDFPVPTTAEEEDRFTDMLETLVLDRTSIPNAISQGISEWRADASADLDEARYKEMDDALYRFFMARVGLRFLTEHHILSSPPRAGKMELNHLEQPGDDCRNEKPQLGCIQKNCCPEREIRKLVAQTIQQTRDRYGVCPEIEIFHSNNGRHSPFTYVPHHLQYMVGELLQNSCEATVRNYLRRTLKGDEYAELDPIRVVIVKGDEDVTIKVADKGGGIPRSKMANIWKFAHSTASGSENHVYDFGIVNIHGFGLPLARIYARYLGGELTLKSMEGYGLDAYLHLPRLGDSCENLPLRVTKSPGDNVSLPRRGKRSMLKPTTSKASNSRQSS